ncbi:MAG: ABC transporter ATP-binding protein [Polyangiaceae bacterium]|nr:ABC transporter ATP-binding protein [Polyangiaceae bacterium]
MADGDKIIDVEDVSQRLGENQILKGVSFAVRDRVRPGTVTGQIVGLLGPSGVGKTRLLRIIAGLDAPDTGKVTGPSGKPTSAGEVGVVFQNYPLLKHRTVLGNLLIAGAANGLAADAAKKKAGDLLSRFGLDARASYYPAQLSGGQRQRVAIAQQLVRQKTILLMDEPFSGLDPESLGNVMSLLVDVANMDELNTIIVVTHDIRAAMTVSDTLFMLGRDDPKATPPAGAKIQKTYDLVAEGLAYRSDLEQDPKFLALEQEIRAAFQKL